MRGWACLPLPPSWEESRARLPLPCCVRPWLPAEPGGRRTAPRQAPEGTPGLEDQTGAPRSSSEATQDSQWPTPGLGPPEYDTPTSLCSPRQRPMLGSLRLSVGCTRP